MIRISFGSYLTPTMETITEPMYPTRPAKGRKGYRRLFKRPKKGFRPHHRRGAGHQCVMETQDSHKPKDAERVPDSTVPKRCERELTISLMDCIQFPMQSGVKLHLFMNLRCVLTTVNNFHPRFLTYRFQVNFQPLECYLYLMA